MSRTFYAIVTVTVYSTLLFLGWMGGGKNVREAEARIICVRPPHMMISGCDNRVPTVAKPYCPFP